MRIVDRLKERRYMLVGVVSVVVVFVFLAIPYLLRIYPPTPTDSTEPVFAKLAHATATSEALTPMLEHAGIIIVANGFACGEIRGGQQVVELVKQEKLPPYVNAATVFLNGWKLRYLEEDLHLRSISASIGDINLNDNEISWVARGYIADNDFHEGYEFCYYYTVLGWNDSEVDALTDHSNSNKNVRISLEEKDKTALDALSSYIRNTNFGDKKVVATLPRGFFFRWTNESTVFPLACFDCPVDRHLLQIGYNMDHIERFVRPGVSR